MHPALLDIPRQYPASLPLAYVSGCVCGIAPRLLISGNTYNMRGRRADNQETNIGNNTNNFSGNDAIIQAGGTLQEWLIGQANTDVRVPTASDQSGTTNHANNTTASTQFYLKQLELNSKPAFKNPSLVTGTFDFAKKLHGYIQGADKKFSLSFVYRNILSAPSGDCSILNCYTTSPIINGFRIYLTGTAGGKQKLLVSIGDGTNYTTIDCASFDANKIYYCTVIYDGSIDTSAIDRVRFYVNGQLLSKNVVTSGGTFPFDIPVNNLPNTQIFSAASTGNVLSLGDWLLFNSILSIEAIQILYQNQLNFYGS